MSSYDLILTVHYTCFSYLFSIKNLSVVCQVVQNSTLSIKFNKQEVFLLTELSYYLLEWNSVRQRLLDLTNKQTKDISFGKQKEMQPDDKWWHLLTFLLIIYFMPEKSHVHIVKTTFWTVFVYSPGIPIPPPPPGSFARPLHVDTGNGNGNDQSESPVSSFYSPGKIPLKVVVLLLNQVNVF